MAVRRAQVSLMFDDADLFENFIIPCKEERRLNGIIVKCLKAYYSNPQVRSLIEGEQDGEETELEGVQSTQSICDSIRASLIMQDYLVAELKQTVDNGIDDVEGLLTQANNTAESHGLGSAYQTKSGSTILQLEAPKQKEPQEQESQSVSTTASAPDGLVSVLGQAVLMLAQDSNNSQVTALLQQILGEQPAVESAEQVETARQPQPQEVPVVASEPAPDFVGDDSVVDIEEGNDFDEDTTVPEEPAEESGEDASDAMMALFGSL